MTLMGENPGWVEVNGMEVTTRRAFIIGYILGKTAGAILSSPEYQATRIMVGPRAEAIAHNLIVGEAARVLELTEEEAEWLEQTMLDESANFTASMSVPR